MVVSPMKTVAVCENVRLSLFSASGSSKLGISFFHLRPGLCCDSCTDFTRAMLASLWCKWGIKPKFLRQISLGIFVWLSDDSCVGPNPMLHMCSGAGPDALYP